MITSKSLGTLEDLKFIQAYEQGLLKSSYTGFQQQSPILPASGLAKTLKSWEEEESEKRNEQALEVMKGGKMVPKSLCKLWKLQSLPSLSQRQLVEILRQEVKDPQLLRALLEEALELEQKGL